MDLILIHCRAHIEYMFFVHSVSVCLGVELMQFSSRVRRLPLAAFPYRKLLNQYNSCHVYVGCPWQPFRIVDFSSVGFAN